MTATGNPLLSGSGECQIYETDSEGTPVSPVFASKDELAEWLVTEGGYSRQAADMFARDGWAPSFMRTPATGGRVLDGIAARGLHAAREAEA